MSTTLQAALLGVVQGLTEFLPVSSSAHLILARMFFGFDGEKFGLAFDVACHVGTLLAVLVYFRAEVFRMAAAALRLGGPAGAAGGRGPVAGQGTGPDGGRLIWLLAVGTLPAVAVGLLFGDAIEQRLRTPVVAAAALGVGAVGLFVAERVGGQRRGEASLTTVDVWWIGCAQAVALVPGVSRSGATIVLALLLGLHRIDAARFVFLLSIPAILAAAAHEVPAVARAGLGGQTGWLFLIGVGTSAVVGYLAVKYFIRYLARHSLDAFAWYRLALTAAVVVWVMR
jgi:undecaprenyl-diphosphatase